MTRYARNVDTTHAPIRDALRKAGFGVVDTSRLGDGFPDLLVHSRGRVVPIEAKTSRNRAGTVKPSQVEPSQRSFAATWRGPPIVVATSPDQAVLAVVEALTRRCGACG